jgi:hypothetical protein
MRRAEWTAGAKPVPFPNVSDTRTPVALPRLLPETVWRQNIRVQTHTPHLHERDQNGEGTCQLGSWLFLGEVSCSRTRSPHTCRAAVSARFS